MMTGNLDVAAETDALFARLNCEFSTNRVLQVFDSGNIPGQSLGARTFMILIELALRRSAEGRLRLPGTVAVARAGRYREAT